MRVNGETPDWYTPYRQVEESPSQLVLGADRRYVERGEWRCPVRGDKGAHHWVAENSTWHCRYCHKTKPLDDTLSQVHPDIAELILKKTLYAFRQFELARELSHY